MNANNFEAGAREILRQHDAKENMVPLKGELAPKDLSAALGIQECFLDLSCGERERTIGGWKVALTTPVMQALVGVDQPCPGAIFADAVYSSPAILSASHYVRIAVESEIAVRIGGDASPQGKPYDRTTISGHVEACMSAIEIVDDRNWDYDSATAVDLVADNSFNFGCVLGPAVENWGSLDLAGLMGRMRINGEVVGEGRGSDVLGHPFEALAWLANHLHSRGRYLAEGDVVLMGSVVATKWPRAGDTVKTEIEGLGEAELVLG